MQDFFLDRLNKSIAAGWLVLAVIVLQPALLRMRLAGSVS